MIQTTTREVMNRAILDGAIQESSNQIWVVRKSYRKFKEQVLEAEGTANTLRIFEQRKEEE